MRQVHSVGIALTLIGMLGLALPPASTPAASYAFALSAGSRLQLVTASRYDTDTRPEGSARRTLACGSVLRLGVADIGFRCSARPVLADAPRQVARAH